MEAGGQVQWAAEETASAKALRPECVLGMLRNNEEADGAREEMRGDGKSLLRAIVSLCL